VAPVVLASQQPIPPSQYRYASFWRRVIAFTIDLLIILALGELIHLGVIIIATIVGTVSQRDFLEFISSPTVYFRILIRGWYISLPVDLFIGWIYFSSTESSVRRATIGKIAVGITVTDLNGNRISFWRASLRYLIKLITIAFLMIGFLIAIFTERRQAIHDKIAKTLVMSERLD
jgi:uncharacterized RDD family membrane protein YckC